MDTVWALDFWASDFWAEDFWTNAGAAAPAAPASGAGRRLKRRRYFVEIDGHEFEVANAQEAHALLERTRALADRAAEAAAHTVQEKRAASAAKRGTAAKAVPPVRLAVPKVSASAELGLDLAPLRAQLARVYADAAMAAEMQLLLARAEEIDEEDAIFLLM